MSAEDRTEILADLRLLRSEYVNLLKDAKSEERSTQLALLLRHIDECIREEESRS